MLYPMFKVHIGDNTAKLVETVLKSGFLNEGTQVQEFLDGLRHYHNFNNIVLTNSCTSALTMAMKLAGVTHGSEVITTSMTCVASNTPIINLGATPVWADINPETGNIDPSDVERLINKRTRAIVCVNWAGMPCEMERLFEISQRRNVKLIQDAAHSFGAKINGIDISNFADFTCYSYQAIKHITCGDGGSIFCYADEDYERAKKMKWFGLDRDKTKDKNGEWKGQRWEADIHEAGYKFNMNNISAAIGISQLPHIDKILSSHRKNAEIYARKFSNCHNVRSLSFGSNVDPSFWVYTVLVENCDRDLVIKTLNDLGIEAGLVHVPNHDYTCFRDIREEKEIRLAGVEKFHTHQISLPCGWWLADEDVEFISNQLISIVEK